MERNNRPHSREKTYGSGKAGVGKGSQINTGSRPVGSGGHSAPSHTASAPSGQNVTRAGTGLNLKSIITLAVIAIIVIFLLKNCGGLDVISSLMGSYDGYTDNSGYTENYTSNTEVSDTKPDYEVAEGAREKFYVPAADGSDKVTIMVYMCGTDLESKYGMATKDLQEMTRAALSDKVNI